MRLNAVLRKVGGRMNPIAVKELRQISRGKFLPVILVGALLMQLTVTAAVSLYSRGSADPGPQLYRALFQVLTAVCYLLIPAYAGFRLANERARLDKDLLFITTLKPASIVWGKTLSAAVLAALIYSVCMPFIAMTYMLRGIDLPSAFLHLFVNYVIMLLIIQIAMMIACLPMGRGLICAIYGLLIAGALAIGFADMRHSGTNALVIAALARMDLTGALGLVAVLTLWIGAFFSLSAAFLAPPLSNRALVPRVYMSAAWAVSLVGVLIWGEMTASYRPIFGWAYTWILLFAFALMFCVSERDEIGLRIREAIPRLRGRRALAFLFYSGSAGGFLWASVGIVLTIAVGSVALSGKEFEAEFSQLCRLSLYAWIGTAGAVLILFKFLKSQAKSMNDWSNWSISMGGTVVVSRWIMHGWPTALVASVAAVLVGLCLPWIVRRAFAFKPLPLKTAGAQRTESACV